MEMCDRKYMFGDVISVYLYIFVFTLYSSAQLSFPSNFLCVGLFCKSTFYGIWL